MLSYQCEIDRDACMKYVPASEKYPVLMYGSKQKMKLFTNKNASVSHIAKFVNKYLKHECSVKTLAWCSQSQVALIKKFSAASAYEIETKVEELKNDILNVSNTTHKTITQLKQKYEYLRPLMDKSRQVGNSTIALLRALYYRRNALGH